MSGESVLIIGGTGTISNACCYRLVSAGFDVTLLNRGTNTARGIPDSVRSITCDIRQRDDVIALLARRSFDVVVDFTARDPDHIRADLDYFRDRTGQFIFISSTAVYQTPPLRLPVTESTPLRNPVWAYAQNKIACEELLVRAYRDDGFPMTIVRPSHTYDEMTVPITGGWSTVERMRAGKPVVLHGDGTAFRTLTHSVDFAEGLVGLIGNPAVIGDAFHITSEEILTWTRIYELIAQAAGVKPLIRYKSTEDIMKVDAALGERLLGDQMHSVIFNNDKIRAISPGFRATISFNNGAKQIIRYHDAEPSHRPLPSSDADTLFDRLLDAP